uniref:Putative RNA-directed DNA polymerase n=1 Tax=Schizaphis graminum TaxID=13262 RepID=A0A2S2P256_SCHGA
MLQRHLNIIDLWTKRWKIKINETKSSFITFTLKKGSCPVVTLNSIPIPSYSEVKYLGLILDSKLTWNPHLKAKRKALNTRLHLLRPLLKSKMNINIKLLIYKSLLRPLWTYGVQLWGAAKPSNTRTIQAFQSICLRLVASAPWYLTNNNLHKDLKIQNLNQISKLYYTRLHNKFQLHTNPLISKLSTNSLPGNPRRRLKRQWCRDLL